MIGKMRVRLNDSSSTSWKFGKQPHDVGIGAKRIRQSAADDRLDVAALRATRSGSRPDLFCSIETGLSSGGGDGLPCDSALLVAPCTQCTPDRSTPYSSRSMPRMNTAAVWV